jgi:predicted dehydrogenase
MIQSAEKSGACLTVGLLRRFLYNARLTARLVHGGMLGRIGKFDFREGNPYSWPVQSDFFFRRETAGGGVLLDTGAHTLDLLLWWLGDVAEIEYFDDNYGGVEADCLLNLKLKSGAEGVVELSRTRPLRNTAILEADNGKLEVHLHRNSLTLQLTQDQCGISGSALDRPDGEAMDQSLLDLAALQLENWIRAIRGEEALAVPAEEAARSVTLIENCYSRRQLWQFPWVNA